MTTFFWIIEYIASFIEIFMCCVFCGTFLVKEEFGDRKYLAFAGAALSALLITGLNKIEIFSVFNSIFVFANLQLTNYPPSFESLIFFQKSVHLYRYLMSFLQNDGPI